MKFVVENRDGIEVEITTLEELRAFALSVNESLIIKFEGVTSNTWFPYGESGNTAKERAYIKQLSDEQTITIYDTDME